jgi:GntR family transcriptional regulator
MFDRIDPRSPVPLYEQIADAVRVAVAAGTLGDGDALPSVRALAGQLRVNPATVVQAYRALEHDGFAEMRQGAGTFVRQVPGAMRSRERAHQALRLVRDLLADAARVGLDADDLRAAFDRESPPDPKRTNGR